VNHNWEAKTTLAYKDTDYKQLGEILLKMKELKFEFELKVQSLALYQIDDGKPEVKISESKLESIPTS